MFLLLESDAQKAESVSSRVGFRTLLQVSVVGTALAASTVSGKFLLLESAAQKSESVSSTDDGLGGRTAYCTLPSLICEAKDSDFSYVGFELPEPHEIVLTGAARPSLHAGSCGMDCLFGIWHFDGLMQDSS